MRQLGYTSNETPNSWQRLRQSFYFINNSGILSSTRRKEPHIIWIMTTTSIENKIKQHDESINFMWRIVSVEWNRFLGFSKTVNTSRLQLDSNDEWDSSRYGMPFRSRNEFYRNKVNNKYDNIDFRFGEVKAIRDIWQVTNDATLAYMEMEHIHMRMKYVLTKSWYPSIPTIFPLVSCQHFRYQLSIRSFYGKIRVSKKIFNRQSNGILTYQ